MATAEIAVMGTKCASEIILKKEISEASDHDKTLLEKEQEYVIICQSLKCRSKRFYR